MADTYYALKEDATGQIHALSLDSSAPTGFTAVELTDTTIPDAGANEPATPDGKLLLGSESIVTVESAALRRMTNAEIDASCLAALKAWRKEQINARTTELRADGWEYPASSGTYYSMSTDAEVKLDIAHSRRADGDFPYPFRLPSIDDASVLELADAAAIDAAHKAMFAAVNDLVDGGVDLKDQIIDAADAAAVLAINDTR